MKLNRVIQETLSLLEHQLQKSGMQVKTDLDAELRPVHGNAGKLQQVFLNLFLNARDAMAGGGALEVRTWQEGGARARRSGRYRRTASRPSICTASTIRSSPPRARARAPASGFR